MFLVKSVVTFSHSRVTELNLPSLVAYVCKYVLMSAERLLVCPFVCLLLNRVTDSFRHSMTDVLQPTGTLNVKNPHLI